MIRIPISVQLHPYEAVVESGLLERAGTYLREFFPGRKRCFAVTVPPVRKKWGKKLMASLAAAGWDAKIVEMRDGERHKTLATVEELAEKLIKAGADRDALILAVGGGVVGDVAAFLASIYMRGVEVVQVPTTVLAQVDASIGGKTGVNLKAGKNLLGTFHQPRLVLIDPRVLKTLPEREFRSGLYEALKCGVIGKSQLFERMERQRGRILQRDPVELEWLIIESVKLKAEVVSADEREGGLRRVLNFGHTIGHALEAETKYRHFLHGEAIAWGMIAASRIAVVMGKTGEATGQRIAEGVLGLGPLPEVRVEAKNIVRLLQADKKTKNGVVHFILPSEIGKVEVVNNVPADVVAEAVADLREISQGPKN
jgi:3-dehydroquinate synthase